MTDTVLPDAAAPVHTSEAQRSPAVPELMLCIASGQSLPNVLPLQVRPWDQLVIYASRDMHAEAQRLALVAGYLRMRQGLPEAGGCEVVELPADLSYRALAAFAAREVERLAQSHPGHRLAFNATGGQKTMTLAFAQALRGRADIFYCQTERDCIELIEPAGPDLLLPAALLDLDTYLGVQGYQITRGVPLEQAWALAQARRRGRLTATLVRRVGELRRSFAEMPAGYPKGAPRNVLGALHGAAVAAVEACRSLSDKAADASFALRQRLALLGESVWWDLLLDEAVSCGVLHGWSSEGSCIELEFADREAAVYLAGGYLEEYVHLAVQALGLPPGAAARGVGVDLLRRRTGRRTAELNELDMAITWRNRLLILECKAGRQLFDPARTQEILNKLSMLRTDLGGTHGQAWILCTGRIDEQSHAEVLERAATAQLQVLGGPELRDLPQRLARALDLAPPAGEGWIDAPLSPRRSLPAGAH
ncbi:Card1-like endonuclease domain-containing protein [Caldimonas tepidiphila]|uniref:Card1-like endonuclease domain-containing protein n=1 Tax=Caldimonas tepidiphila TaxID=2315841 RepID=UPI00147476BB|nr:DUF1887 family CARF protein [Caldimonas tepidiphila]